MRRKKPGTRAEEMAWEAVDQALLGAGTREERAGRLFRMLEQRVGPVEKEPTLGEELKRRRQALKLTPIKAAGKASVPAARWRLWEANLGVPTRDELSSLSRTLGPDGLLLLWRKAPRVVLGQVLDTRPTLKVARSSGERPLPSPREHWRLAVANLDPQVRQALERHVRETRGQEPGEELLAELLETASTWSWGKKDLWIRDVLR